VPGEHEARAKLTSLKCEKVLVMVPIVICWGSTDEFSDLAVTSGEVVCYVVHGSPPYAATEVDLRLLAASHASRSSGS
jgi:hypothetical protein